MGSATWCWVVALGSHQHPSKGQGREDVQNQVRAVTLGEGCLTGAVEKHGPLSDRPGRVGSRRKMSRALSAQPIYFLLVPCTGQVQREIRGQGSQTDAVHSGQSAGKLNEDE